MDLGLKGKVAFVVGGGRGLARGVADALAAEGASVALASRDRAALERAAQEMAALGGKILPLVADLEDPESMRRAFGEAERALGPVDILLNNSGGPQPSPAVGVDASTWRAQFERMVLAILGLTDLALPGMRRRGWGRVLTIASSGVVEPIAGLALSNTLRSALVGWSKTLAQEVGRDGVTVNVLVPGRIATDRVRALDAHAAERSGVRPEDVTARQAEQIPLGRYGTIAEFGAVAAFLASERASYVTGSLIRVDGGAIRSV
jgi:3-oxoacyl-[acyl-carrier protein] reductase